MNTLKAIEIKKAIFTLSELLDIEAKDLVGSICFLNKPRFEKFKEASLIWNAFDDAGIVERGEMLGLKILVS